MATKTALSPSAAKAAPKEADADAKSDQQLHARLNDFLRQYSPPQPASSKDTLNNRFKVDLSIPLPDFDNKAARAYDVTDTTGEYKKLFALVLNPGRVVRNNLIENMKGFRNPGMVSLLATGIVEFSRPAEERFVLVYERPAGRKLSQLLSAQNFEVNDYFVVNSIISPIINVIHQLSELNITHGSINPDNIYFQEIPVLGDCICEPCGYSQPYYCEPIERMICLPAAKGEGTSAVDYYALAVVVLYTLFGRAHFDGMTKEELTKEIFKNGAYVALMKNRDTSLLMDEFFRGTLGQDAEHRWNYRYLKSWVEGRRSSAVVGRSNTEVLKPFEYGDGASEIYAGSRIELAHDFYTHWDSVGDILHGGHLISWMAVNLRNKELVTEIGRIAKSASQMSAKQDHQLAEQYMRLIVALDPAGPIRIFPLSMHVDGIHTLCAELHANKAERELQVLSKFIEHDMVSYWSQHQVPKEGIPTPAGIKAMLTRLDKLRLLIRNQTIGFGIERLLYELNPEMPCQSTLCAGAHVTSLAALLKQLDRQAPAMYAQQDPLDRHVAAFISQKLNLQSELRLHELSAIPSLASNRSIMALRLLALAQHRAGTSSLPGLSHWLAIRILPSLEVIRSNTLRDRLKATLVKQAEKGSLFALEQLVIDHSYTNADKGGYQRAISTYANNTQRILAYRTPEVIDHDSHIAGATIAKSFAYFAFAVTLFFTLRGYL